MVAWGSSPRVRGRRHVRGQGDQFRGLIPAGAGQTHVGPFCLGVSSAHPRGCGADEFLARHPNRVRGSSPRVRGRPVRETAPDESTRLIPAGAGQTSKPSSPLKQATAHPRGCGADSLRGRVCACPGGSSPRVRGRLIQRGCSPGLGGLIPAGAGQTLFEQSADAQGNGSSPRVRGRPEGGFRGVRESGLIPAGAGQTKNRQTQAVKAAAHPRGCGADGSRSRVRRVSGGSSPRVRGRHCRLLIGRWFRGLIPAGAGQTARWITEPGVVTAHPRGCGADVTSGAATPGVSGSSPRVRGRHPSFSAYFEFSGLIPAGAGQTVPSRYGCPANPAHPRGCGADCTIKTCAIAVLGSSPRVRGRRFQLRLHSFRSGLIPAGAGQTAAGVAVG